MEIRSVQVTGGSSYSLTLPKEWIKSSKIQKNDSIGIQIQPDGTLLITPKITKDNIQKIKEFDITNVQKTSYLFRYLIAAYIAGFSTIKINASQRILPPFRSIIRSFTQATIGQEIVEETDVSITLKDLINPVEMPFDRTIKRMHIIVKGMHDDAMRALQKKDTELAKDILYRDNEVDRLNWLIARQYNSIMQNMSLAEKMETTIEMASTYFLISRVIERIGDHVVKMAHNIISLNNIKYDSDLISKITIASNKSQDILSQSIISFFRKDINSSNENIETVEELRHLCEEIDKLSLQQQGLVAISIGNIIESVRRIGEYAEDISEHIINYLIDEDKKIKKNS